MVKIQKLPNGQLVITIPKRLAELKGWDKGMNLVFTEHGVSSFVVSVKKDEADGSAEKKGEESKDA